MLASCSLTQGHRKLRTCHELVNGYIKVYVNCKRSNFILLSFYHLLIPQERRHTFIRNLVYRKHAGIMRINMVDIAQYVPSRVRSFLFFNNFENQLKYSHIPNLWIKGVRWDVNQFTMGVIGFSHCGVHGRVQGAICQHSATGFRSSLVYE